MDLGAGRVLGGDVVKIRVYPLRSESLQRSAKRDFKWSVPLVIVKYVSAVTVLLDTRIPGL
jgi:hypothetical protein